MSGWIPERYRRDLLGNDVSQISEVELQKLIGLSEGQEIEFKREMYKSTPGARKQFAYDVAQFANATGGLLIIGVREDGSGNAVALTPIDITDEPVHWIHQVLADKIFPRLVMSTEQVGVGDEAVIVISVPRSKHPHAVAGDDGILKYPVRVGPQRSWLSEAEVSERYARRFRNLLAVESRLDELQATGLNALPTRKYPELHRTYLILCAVPEEQGILELHSGLSEEYQTMLREELAHFPVTRDFRFSVRPGFRSLQLDNGSGCDGGAMNLDGDGFLFLSSFPTDRDTGTNLEDRTFGVVDSHLYCDLVSGLRTLAMHASVSGALGALNIAAQMAAPDASFINLLGTADGAQIRHSIAGTSSVRPPSPVSRRSFGIDALLSDPVSLISAARLLASDLFSAFGMAEPLQASSDGALQKNGFDRQAHNDISEWAANNNIEFE